MKNDYIDYLDGLLELIPELEYGDDHNRDRLMKKGEMLIRRICGEDSHYVDEYRGIWFIPSYAPSSAEAKAAAWESGKGKAYNVINTIREELLLFDESDQKTAPQSASAPQSNDIFVVHGHDEELKQSVARTLEKLDLNPIILHEKPNKGRTIIEKFSDYSNVGFAVVLLSPDDIAHARDTDTESFRARQNVILELGFFLGKLGRERVASIFQPHEDFEMPSDYDGVIFIEYNDSGTWRFKLAKELKEAGYEIDFNAIA